MPDLDALLHETAARHHSLCPRQVLGVRMGLYGGVLLGLEVPQTDKRLFVFMETDGCGADGVSVASGCWVGRRTMRIVDYGKLAATFVDTETGRAVRVWPNPAARDRAVEFAPAGVGAWHAQLQGYAAMPDELLLLSEPVTLTVSLADIISQPGLRAVCNRCGEEIMNHREVVRDGRALCRSCADGGYYRAGNEAATAEGAEARLSRAHPPVVGIAGRSGTGKTTFLEKLLPELKRRGYRVGTIKHHAHPGFEIDHPGKDTWRHAQAGSDHVVIAAPDRVAAIRRVDGDPPLDSLAATMADVDLILTEGYGRAPIPKLELVRAAHSTQPICDPAHVVGYITDLERGGAAERALPDGIPRLRLDDVAGVADLIEAHLGQHR